MHLFIYIFIFLFNNQSLGSEDQPFFYQSPCVDNEFMATHADIYRKTRNTRAVAAMTPEWILKLYQLMKDVHEIFGIYGIIYWADGGTLVGAIRHRGLIPWDDDLDIDIHKEQEPLLLSIKPILESYGFGLYPTSFGYKVYSFDGYAIPNHVLTYPQLDIFIMTTQDEKIAYDPSKGITWAMRKGEPIYITQTELYPLKKVAFGQINIFIPNNPISFLNHHYGNTWPDIAKKFNHLTKEKETVTLAASDKQAAQPTGPLKNRINI